MLALTLLCVGRAKAGAERDLATRYVERARATGRPLGLTLDIREIGESRATRPADRKREEAAAIRALLTEGGTGPVVFDERGSSVDSQSFAAFFRAALDQGEKSLTFIVGGPDGLDPSIREAAAKLVAFGAMTWPHQLVRIMATEQIYRALTILSGHPYHRN